MSANFNEPHTVSETSAENKQKTQKPSVSIRNAENKDLNILSENDKHIDKKELGRIISLNRVYVLEEGGELIGWLRYGLFWDNTPFMNMLYILDGYRKRGYGRELVLRWEADMKKQGFNFVMTSTASDEYAQHFYIKLDYSAIGGFTLPGDPYEIILIKTI